MLGPKKKITDPKFLPVYYEAGSFKEFTAALQDVVDLEPPVSEDACLEKNPKHSRVPPLKREVGEVKNVWSLKDQKDRKEQRDSATERNGVLSSIAPKNPDGLPLRKQNTKGATTP